MCRVKFGWGLDVGGLRVKKKKIQQRKGTRAYTEWISKVVLLEGKGRNEKKKQDR